MNEKIKDKIFNGLIISFLILYMLVACISCYHCVEFCMVGNPMILSVMMSFAFEVGLALTLFSVLITDENKNNIVSWILMSLLTCVQIMGNIFSVEKYMELSNNNFYIYIQHGFLHWFTDDMPQTDIMSIIAILLGALLPIVALLMTSMVARNWKDRMREKKGVKEEVKENDDEKTNNDITYSSPDTLQKNKIPVKQQENKLNEMINKAKELAEKSNKEKNQIIDIKPEMNDGSLLTPEESEHARQQKPFINLFNPINQ